MPGSFLGSLKVAARRIGCSLSEYEQRTSVGEKWCWACQRWRCTSQFADNLSRGDFKCAMCRSCKAARKQQQRAKRRLARVEGIGRT